MARKVRAIAMGFHDGARVRPGVVFAVPDKFKASWVEDVDPPAPPPPPSVDEAPADPPPAPTRRTLRPVMPDLA